MKINFFNNLLQKRPAKNTSTSVCMWLTVLFGKNIVKLLVLVRILLNANVSAIIKNVL